MAAVVAAVITLVALNSSSDASSSWQSALRQDVARGVSAVNDIHYVYEVEAPGAFQIAVGEVQAEEYRRAASSAAPDIAARLAARAQVLEMSVAAVRTSFEMAVPAYALPSGGYDPLHRLADQLADPTRVTRDPDGAMATGDAAAARADRLIDSIVIVSLAFLFGALAETFWRARRQLLAVGLADARPGCPGRHRRWPDRMIDIETVQSTEAGTRFHRAIAILLGIIAVLAAGLGAVQLHRSQSESRATVEAARLTGDLAAGIPVSSMTLSMTGTLIQAAITRQLEGTTRQFVSLQANDPAGVAEGVAEQAAGGASCAHRQRHGRGTRCEHRAAALRAATHDRGRRCAQARGRPSRTGSWTWTPPPRAPTAERPSPDCPCWRWPVCWWASPPSWVPTGPAVPLLRWPGWSPGVAVILLVTTLW